MKKTTKPERYNNKECQTINFDKAVLLALKARCDKEGTTISHFVNALCKRHVMTDALFYSEMAKQHYLKMQEALFLRDQTANAAVVLGVPLNDDDGR